MNAEPTSNNLHARTQPPCIHQTQPYDSYALLRTYTHPAYELQRPARNYSQSTTSLAQSELYIITPDVISCTAPPLCCCDFSTSREKAISLTTMTWGTHHPHRIASHCIASPRIDLVVMRRCVLRMPASVNSVSQGVPGCWYRAHKPQGVMSTSSSDLECRNTYSGTRVPTIPPIDTFFPGPPLRISSPPRTGARTVFQYPLCQNRLRGGPLGSFRQLGFSSAVRRACHLKIEPCDLADFENLRNIPSSSTNPSNSTSPTFVS